MEDLTKDFNHLSTNFNVKAVQNLINKYHLSNNAERMFDNYGGNEDTIRALLEKQHRANIASNSRATDALLKKRSKIILPKPPIEIDQTPKTSTVQTRIPEKSVRSSIHKLVGGKKSRRNTRRQRNLKKQKSHQKQTRKYRHSRRH